MPNALIRNLGLRYAFDDWRGTNTLPSNLFVWRYLLLGSELPGWLLHRARRFRGPDGITVLQSVWRQVLPPSVLGIDVIECESLAAAHDRVLQVLASFEAPVMQRDTQSVLGDVAFVGPREHVQVFARANLVFLLRNAGPVAVRVSPLASRLDRRLVTPPAMREPAAEAVAASEVPAIRALSVKRGADRRELRLGLDVERPTGTALAPMVKLVTDGEITRAGDRLTYRPADRADVVTVYAIAANLVAAHRRFRIVT